MRRCHRVGWGGRVVHNRLLLGLASFATLFQSIQDSVSTLEKGYHPPHLTETHSLEHDEEHQDGGTKTRDGIKVKDICSVTDI